MSIASRPVAIEDDKTNGNDYRVGVFANALLLSIAACLSIRIHLFTSSREISWLLMASSRVVAIITLTVRDSYIYFFTIVERLSCFFLILQEAFPVFGVGGSRHSHCYISLDCRYTSKPTSGGHCTMYEYHRLLCTYVRVFNV